MALALTLLEHVLLVEERFGKATRLQYVEGIL
jgi:hypothetical protein